jgi:hypothetical protein
MLQLEMQSVLTKEDAIYSAWDSEGKMQATTTRQMSY